MTNHGGHPFITFKQFQANVLYIHVLGHPRKGEYSGLISAQNVNFDEKN